jgi:hypothetical protein
MFHAKSIATHFFKAGMYIYRQIIQYLTYSIYHRCSDITVFHRIHRYRVASTQFSDKLFALFTGKSQLRNRKTIAFAV